MIMRTGDVFVVSKKRYEFLGVDLKGGWIVIKDVETGEELRKTNTWFEIWAYDSDIAFRSNIMYEMLKVEIPFRLFEIYDYDEENTPPGVVDNIIKRIFDDCDSICFDYDRIDNKLFELYEEECAKYDENHS